MTQEHINAIINDIMTAIDSERDIALFTQGE